MRSSAPAAPPLWIWASSVALALALLAASLPAFLTHEAESARLATPMDVALRNFDRDTPRRRSVLRVIAFGDSALATATKSPDDMTAYARETRGLELSFLRLWRQWYLLHHVVSVVGAAIDTAPDIVMLDSWTLFYPLDRYAVAAYRSFLAEQPADMAGGLQRIADKPSLVFDHQAFLFDALTGSTSGQTRIEPDAPSKGRRRRELHCDEATRQRSLRMAGVRNPEGGQPTVDPLARQAIETLLERAAARGVRIVFFDVPKAPRLESLPGVRQKRALTRDLLREYVRQGRAEYLEFPGQIDDDDTCDYIHYTARGRDRYLQWFVGELAALRAKRERR